ncbi:hypothetical protein F2Q69_00059878 [Brassica cretica]|uniref:Uncharacterized protein n=1 Tax=Brassica cretica TaxID=69181 RepID=A0A8S9RSH1_BRACR|nr:hypothetical protein F2Q69_00059878 [Brassica cretica]
MFHHKSLSHPAYQGRTKRKLSPGVQRLTVRWNPQIDLAVDVESLKPMAISTMPSRIGPPSVIGKDDIREWRKMYSLMDDAIFQVPGPGNQDSYFGVDEMIVYEAFFK